MNAETSCAITREKINESQPRGLYLLFFTELWERFGFYTLQAIIILYMTKALLMQDHNANMLYAAFSALLYLTPTIGGYLADRYFGFQRAILIGGLLFIIGYLICANEDKTFFFLGLSVLICGHGLFKPNVSSIVGELYSENDPRRESGFTLFYMGINIGALIPPLISGYLISHYSWHAGFLVAAGGMFLGQIIFLLGLKHFDRAGAKPKHTISNFKLYGLLCLGIVISILLCQLAFLYPQATSVIVTITALTIFLVVVIFMLKESQQARRKMIAALILIGISAAFWSLYNQTFTSLTLFADRNMAKTFLGFAFDAEASQFFNPFFIILLSPVLGRVWVRMDNEDINPSIQMKFFLGAIFLSLGFLMLAFATNFLAHNGLVSPWWLCASYFLQTLGELLISPIGLAMITVLCPKHLVGMMMGIWFFAQATSFSIGGYLANIAAAPQHLSVLESLNIYNHAFTIYGLISVGIALLSFACLPLLNRLVNH